LAAAIADTIITMAVISNLVTAFAVMFPLLAEPAAAGSIADIEHVILFMQGTSARAMAVYNFSADELCREQSIRPLFRDDGRRPRFF
jgi:hypothetical protein